MLLTRRAGSHTQARDEGYACALALQQLEVSALLGRVDALASSAGAVRSALAPRPRAASGVGSALARTTLGFASLPHAVALRVFACVPADARARAALVCRAWRDAIAEPSVWARLDLLSPTSGVTVELSDALLRGAATRAHGQLSALLLNWCYELSTAAVLEVVASNAGSLRELTCWSNIVELADYPILAVYEVEELARAAPQLRVLNVDVKASGVAAVRLLRNDSPFEPLRLRDLEIDGADEDEPAVDADVLAVAEAVPRHASLQRVYLLDVSLRTPAVLDALAAAVIACALPTLWLVRCDLSPASVPALERVLRSGALTSLELDNDHELLLEEAAAVQLSDAIAAHHTLRHLGLVDVQFWNDAPAAAAVMRAVTGHPSLQKLNLFYNDPLDPAAAGAALGTLVTANSPALRELRILSSPRLGDVGMRPVLDALAHNTHLRLLDCCNTGMSSDFVQDVFLPSVRANTSLRTLQASEWWNNEEDGIAPRAVLETEALVAARSAGGAA